MPSGTSLISDSTLQGMRRGEIEDDIPNDARIEEGAYMCIELSIPVVGWIADMAGAEWFAQKLVGTGFHVTDVSSDGILNITVHVEGYYDSDDVDTSMYQANGVDPEELNPELLMTIAIGVIVVGIGIALLEAFGINISAALWGILKAGGEATIAIFENLDLLIMLMMMFMFMDMMTMISEPTTPKQQLYTYKGYSAARTGYTKAKPVAQSAYQYSQAAYKQARPVVSSAGSRVSQSTRSAVSWVKRKIS